MEELLGIVGAAHNLVVFEAAARHGSLTAAARALGVTQQAVSRNVLALEAALGTQLFVRRPRTLELTPAGEVLYHGVDRGLGAILDAARKVRRVTENQVIIHASPAVVLYWLVPRLAALHASNREIDLTFTICHKQVHVAEEATALGIQACDGRWPGHECCLLVPEEVFPVAAPALARALSCDGACERLLDQPLIHLDEPFFESVTWARWLRHFGVEYRDDGPGLRFTDYAAVLQAAMAGEGIALGLLPTASALIDEGRLMRVGERSWRTENGVYLVWSSRLSLTPQARAVRDWIAQAAQHPVA